MPSLCVLLKILFYQGKYKSDLENQEKSGNLARGIRWTPWLYLVSAKYENYYLNIPVPGY